jgi:hypothetical protein
MGVGNGPFDEHVVDDDTSKKTECAATLVAKFLGLHEDAHWSKVLKYVLHTDKHPPTLVLDLSGTVMRLQRQGWSLEATLLYTDITLSAYLKEQAEFFRVPIEDIRKETLLLHGEEQWIAVVEGGENAQTPALARFFGATVVVVKSPSGHVQILSNKSHRLRMQEVVRVLRVLEQRTRRNITITDWQQLQQEGTLTEIPEWFFHGEANNILNGGRSRPDIPPTKLPLQLILQAVRIGLEHDRFHPTYQEKCSQGICSSTSRNPCPWYAFGLSRCRTIRHQMHS